MGRETPTKRSHRGKEKILTEQPRTFTFRLYGEDIERAEVVNQYITTTALGQIAIRLAYKAIQNGDKAILESMVAAKGSKKPDERRKSP